jgi:hypothetical protein
MNALRRKPRLTGSRPRWLTMLCIALTLTFGARAAVSVSESVHHEVEVTQAASPTVAIICLGDDRSCGLPEHDENQVIPHVHAADIGSAGLPAVETPAVLHELKAESVALPASLSVEGLTQPTPERPPRTTCI